RRCRKSIALEHLAQAASRHAEREFTKLGRLDPPQVGSAAIGPAAADTSGFVAIECDAKTRDAMLDCAELALMFDLHACECVDALCQLVCERCVRFGGNGESREVPQARPAFAVAPLHQQHALAATHNDGGFAHLLHARLRLGDWNLVLESMLKRGTQR